MISVKSLKDIGCMRRAGRIAHRALMLAGSLVQPGISTGEIDDAVREYIHSAGAVPTFLGYCGYPASTNISINHEVIHGIPSPKRLIQEGDIVSVDVGATIDGFVGDNAWTFAAGGVSPAAQRLMDVTHESLNRAIQKARKGNRVGDIGYAVQSYAEQNGYAVIRKFIGHGVGRELHEDPEVPNFGRPDHGVRLIPGMTIAIEPMVVEGHYDIEILDDHWTVVTKDKSLAAHFENTVLITDDDPVILTAQ